ncbi:MAG: hypothetical protein IOD15_00090 [Phycisphaerales bacterium]|nr:hypothetical protein [Phycisphaerales bacterium]
MSTELDKAVSLLESEAVAACGILLADAEIACRVGMPRVADRNREMCVSLWRACRAVRREEYVLAMRRLRVSKAVALKAWAKREAEFDLKFGHLYGLPKAQGGVG